MAVMMMKYMPHAQMILAQAAFNRGLNPYVYVTYRYLLAACILCPFAYFYEKTLRPKMTLMLFLEIFVLSLLGGSLTLNMYFSRLKYTSPTFVTSMINTVASITFVIAIVLRMEIVDVMTLRRIAKIAGTMVSLAGATTMNLYRGAAVKRLWRAPIHIHGTGGSGGGVDHVVAHESWVKGSLLALASCICWSIWIILQRDVEDWLIGFGLNFWCIVYTAIACNGLTVIIQLWCNKKKGPVFVTMFNPLLTVMVAILAYVVFGENLYAGSVIRGVLVILGLYMLRWGKDKDQEQQH
ncbi:unnamed protein product [Miscanthus lutarioriparius]|uniref:WAT1-related protein n=1 Tax=Miscanthus lutarioriparius TaxID=422564 RepID=A0A811SU18_9POAL|nr:unnamed protein product [Miscanthus lutarioriparius]